MQGFSISFKVRLLRLSGYATAITAVGVINKGFTVSSHVAVGRKATATLLYITSKARTTATLHSHAAVTVNLPLGSKDLICFNQWT